jgi:hypothetical protein
MKKGDRVVCVKLPDPGMWFDNNPITLGKTYTVTKYYYSQKAVYVINDNNCEQGYWQCRFKLCNEVNNNITIL